MSADRWSHCPNCDAEAHKKAEAARSRALESYGKVPLGEYLKLDKEANELAAAAEEIERFLREDWDLGINGTEFEVSYRASCQKCNWSFTHKHTEQVKTNGD